MRKIKIVLIKTFSSALFLWGGISFFVYGFGFCFPQIVDFTFAERVISFFYIIGGVFEVFISVLTILYVE